MTHRLVRFSALAIVAASLTACGSKAPKPGSELALADSALQSAETSGAREYAPIELRIAPWKEGSGRMLPLPRKSMSVRVT